MKSHSAVPPEPPAAAGFFSPLRSTAHDAGPHGTRRPAAPTLSPKGDRKMRRSRLFLQALAAAAGFALFVAASPAMSADAPSDAAAKKDIVLKGDAKCTRCHDEGDDYPVLAIGKTRHGTVADGRTPTCTNCHGESESHINNTGGTTGHRALPDVRFRGKEKSSPEAQNGQSLTCHATDAK